MMQNPTIDDLVHRLAAAVPAGTDPAPGELRAGLRGILRDGLRGLDLVTREEYDVQRCVLLRTREKIEEVEQRLLALERALGASLAQRN